MHKAVKGVWNRNRPCADLIYWKEDNFGASTFISAAIESKLRVFDSPYNAKGTLEVTYEMSLNHINQQLFYYSLCNNMFSLSKTISRQNFLTMVYYTKLALHKLSITSFNQQWTIVFC